MLSLKNLARKGLNPINQSKKYVISVLVIVLFYNYMYIHTLYKYVNFIFFDVQV